MTVIHVYILGWCTLCNPKIKQSSPVGFLHNSEQKDGNCVWENHFLKNLLHIFLLGLDYRECHKSMRIIAEIENNDLYDMERRMCNIEENIFKFKLAWFFVINKFFVLKKNLWSFSLLECQSTSYGVIFFSENMAGVYNTFLSFPFFLILKSSVWRMKLKLWKILLKQHCHCGENENDDIFMFALWGSLKGKMIHANSCQNKVKGFMPDSKYVRLLILFSLKYMNEIKYTDFSKKKPQCSMNPNNIFQMKNKKISTYLSQFFFLCVVGLYPVCSFSCS